MSEIITVIILRIFRSWAVRAVNLNFIRPAFKAIRSKHVLVVFILIR